MNEEQTKRREKIEQVALKVLPFYLHRGTILDGNNFFDFNAIHDSIRFAKEFLEVLEREKENDQ